LKALARELGQYKLDFLGVEEVRWENGGTEGQRVIHFSKQKGMGIVS
jgi:hypothetical protein